MKKIGVITIIFFALLFALSTTSFVPAPIEASFNKFIPEMKKPVTMFMSGDIMLGRYVETLMKREGDDYPFQAMKEVYADSDLVFGNLEGPIRTNHFQTPDNTMVFSFRPETGEILSQNGFNIMTLANNHTFDKAQEGLDETQQYLTDAGIDYFGHPKDVADVLEKEVNGHDLVFIGLHDTFLNDLDRGAALTLVRDYKEQKKFVMVSVHWGAEYKIVSNRTQQDFARDLVNYGADVVIGHHPHVVQEIEEYNGSLIFYSLGNFIFDQYFSKDTQQGLALEMTIEKNKLGFELIPVDIIRSQPIVMEDDQEFLLELAERSSESIKLDILSKQIELNRKTKADLFPLSNTDYSL